jgi:hypothetical protein
MPSCGGSAATLPVLPVGPITSDAKKKPPPLAVKLAAVMPVNVTSNERGPGFGWLAPFPQPVGTVQMMDCVRLPNTLAESGPPAAKPLQGGIRKAESLATADYVRDDDRGFA